MSHLDDALIQELLDGEVPSAELAPIQRHLAACEACRSRLEAARAIAHEADLLVEALDDARPAAVVLPMPRAARWPRHLAWAASVALAVGLGYAGHDVLDRQSGLPRPADSVPQTSAPARDDETGVAEESPSPLAAGARETAVGGAPAATAPNTVPPARREAPVAEPTRQAAREVADPQAMAGRDAESSPPAEIAANREARADERVTSKQLVDAVTPSGRQVAPTVGGAAPLRGVEPAPALPPGALVPRDQVTSGLARSRFATVVDTIELPEAMRRLGGSIKLVEGWVPVRLEGSGGEVAVIYASAWGTVQLRQSRDGETLTWRLVTPSTVPDDSLSTWRNRVKP